MPRKSRATGVGRGNGVGSGRTQFRDGMPSGNPSGRPKKIKVTPPASIQEALSRAMQRPIVMREGSREKTLPQFEAMIEVMLNDFPRASLNQKIRLLTLCMSIAPDLEQGREPETQGDALQKFADWIMLQGGAESD